MPPPPAPRRRALNLEALEPHVRSMRLRAGVELPPGKKKLSLERDLFVPRIQADVGSSVAVTVYRYRLLIPVAQTTKESAQAIRRVLIANLDEIQLLQEMFVRHFGGVTV